jgi:outer membrane biosynthesis protein TonB
MPLTQIPLEPPPQPPQGRNPDQGDLFDTTSWESAYRELHDFPTLLIQTRDELSRARKREALWISLIAHLVLVIIIVNSPKFEKYLPHRAVMMVHSGRENEKLTFLETPPDAQKPVQPPKTNVMSDKSRMAMSRAPKLDQKELKKILDASRQGRPGPVAPQISQQPQTPPPSASQSAQVEPQQPPQPPSPPQQMAKLQAPPVTRKPAPNFNTGPMSASKAIDEAARQAAVNHGRFGGGDAGDLGLGQRQPTMRMGDVDITSDTMGVDFGPYLQRVLHDVKQNWYNLIPESAMPPLLKKGKLSIEFAITKTGQIAGLRYVTGSGDVALDRAAYGGITASNPFPPLPSEFGGQYLGLRFTFLYNPDPNQADLH